jgi:hypothetical protein
MKVSFGLLYRTNATSKASVVDKAGKSLCAFFRDTKRDQGEQHVGGDSPKTPRGQSHRLQIRAVEVIETLSMDFSWKGQKVWHSAALSENEERLRYILSYTKSSRISRSLLCVTA